MKFPQSFRSHRALREFNTDELVVILALASFVLLVY